MMEWMIIIPWVLVGILVIIILALVYILARISKNAYNTIGFLTSSLNIINKEINETYLIMKKLDNNQMFEKDDDVGVIWTKISGLIEQLKYQATELLDKAFPRPKK